MRFNRLLMVLSIIMIGITFNVFNVQAENDPLSSDQVHIQLDGQALLFDTPPTIIEGTTLVPFRKLFETFGLEVGWNADTKTVTGRNDHIDITLQIDNPTVYINKQPTIVDVAPQLINSVTMVPIRLVSEALHLTVDWDGDNNTVLISSTTYEAQLIDGKAEGPGKLYEWGKLVYEGDFKEGQAHGQGRTFYGEGKLMYEGSFENGMMQGEGKLYREDGSLWYDAAFEQSSIQGFGTVYFPLGHRLEVHFIDGNPHGAGTYFYGDGTIRFIGQYKNGLRNGPGTEYYADGNIMYEGTYLNSKLISGKLYYEDGTLWYEGQFSGYMSHGKGVEYNEDGTIYHKGRFIEGQPVKEE